MPEVFIGSALGAAVCFFVVAIPVEGAYILLYVLPVGSAWALRALGEPDGRDAESAAADDPTEEAAKLSGRIIAGTVVYGLATGAVEALATSADGGAASSLSVTFVLFVLYCAAALQLYGGRPLSVGVRAVLPTGPDQEVGPLGGAYRLAILLMVGGFVAVPLLESVGVSGVAVVLAGYLGVFSVLVSLFLIMGRISIGTFALFNSLCWTLTNPMSTLGMLINDLQRFFASASKIVELYYARSTIVTRQDAVKKEGRVQGAVKFDHVTLKRNGTEVLHDINLDIKPGETIAIMGPTGCGKTSLISLIPRFSDVSGGTVSVDGTPVGMYDLKKLRGSVGIATQDVFLFSDTVDGNIAYGDPEMSEDDVKRFAKIACVDFVDKLPEGFDTVIGERGTGLSGGQKQRIALARALAIKPSILILDDTTSAVDMETEKYIQDQLAHLDFDCTKIIVAQRISTTKRADRIVILDKGRVVDVGTHEELISRPGYYREVYELQNGIAGEKKGGAA